MLLLLLTCVTAESLIHISTISDTSTRVMWGHSVSVEVVHPGVALGTGLLTGGKLSLVAFVAEVTPAFLLSTPAWSVGEVAVEDRGGMDLGKGLRVSGPGYKLLGCYKIHIRESKDGIDELEETVFTMRSVEKPCSMEEKREGSFALCIVLQEVLCENLLD